MRNLILSLHVANRYLELFYLQVSQLFGPTLGQEAKSPIYILAATQTRLADVATGEVVASPNDIARLGFAVAA
ncbi:hypothetical protein IAF22_20350, partial [Acinetobacter baumannii]|nr:hypothetical protein [Acinetobacter baumannii]